MRSFPPRGNQARDVVRMLVRDQNASEILWGAADGSEPLSNLAEAESRIDQDAGLFGLNVRAVASGTAAENRQVNRHGKR